MFKHDADTAVAPHSASVCYEAYLHPARHSECSGRRQGAPLHMTQKLRCAAEYQRRMPTHGGLARPPRRSHMGCSVFYFR